MTPTDLYFTSFQVNVKISDYGIARFAAPYGLALSEGTPGYQAPEVSRGEAYSYKVKVDAPYGWLSARPQYLQCVSTGDTAVLHWAIDIIVTIILFLPIMMSWNRNVFHITGPLSGEFIGHRGTPLTVESIGDHFIKIVRIILWQHIKPDQQLFNILMPERNGRHLQTTYSNWF